MDQKEMPDPLPSGRALIFFNALFNQVTENDRKLKLGGYNEIKNDVFIFEFGFKYR
ncbi:hypothetical protein PB1_14034 [Bacillus methanolicus PB1]|uniref:Uncharacterized protein n=1 Tax=Bacillus methanolicus PB1 TaxID=997296 RepID=I3DWR2_BACMT|nr:hypothetical protein PB1_14034 [Bacillus methanolicus PB1]